MTLANRSAETVDEDVVLTEHLHERVLDELTCGACREERGTFGFPRVSAGNGFEVAAPSVFDSRHPRFPETRERAQQSLCRNSECNATLIPSTSR